MKKILKKYDKLIMLLCISVAVVVLSWFIKGGTFANGVYAELGYSRAGIYDLFYYIYGTVYYKMMDVFFILMIGGCYGVLAETKSYRKLVDKAIDFIHGKEKWVLAVLVLVMGIFVSISTQILALLIFVPFIVTVFIGDGKDRMTAFLASFGGIFVGLLGQTFGTFGMKYMNEYLMLDFSKQFLLKAVIFVLMYALFVAFAILHMNKNKKPVDEIDYDLFATEELDESGVKAKKKVKLWPTIVLFVLLFVSVFVAYISWDTGFGVKYFAELFNKFNTKFLVFKEVPLIATLFGTNSGNAREFGALTDMMFSAFSLVLITIVMAIINKIKVGEFFYNFGEGLKKMVKVAIVYALCFTPILLTTQYPWLLTVMNSLLVDKFNIIQLFFGGFAGQTLLVEQDLLGYLFGQYLATNFKDNIVLTSIIWRFGYGISLLVGPTSFVLLSGLTYLDISYGKWLKYVWKFALSAIVIFMLAMYIVVYL